MEILMRRKHLVVCLNAFCVALLSASPAFTQTPSDEATTEAKAAAPVAHVYVQTNEGINAYDAAADGKLTLIKGSPFQTAGAWMEASNGKYLFSFDANNHVRTYAIESNGAIGKQVSEIDAQDYSGADCSGTAEPPGVFRGVLDHTGKSLYVQIFGYALIEGGVQAVCSAYQSYQVSASGKLTFNGAYIWSAGCCDGYQNLTLTGNDHFVYGLNSGGAVPAIQYFVREPNGALNNFNGSAETPPSPPASTPFGEATWTWQPNLVEADPFGHVGVLGIFQGDTPQGDISSGRKLVSYTVGPTGDLVTNNTYAELATLAVYPEVLNMSPSGKFLAAGGEGQGQGGGLQIFHFNGAAPITAYSGALTNASEIDAIHWDNNNHLYAVGIDDRLYVYTVTAKEITKAPGSPYRFKGGLEGEGLIVLPK
jgi:hypothetical protein